MIENPLVGEKPHKIKQKRLTKRDNKKLISMRGEVGYLPVDSPVEARKAANFSWVFLSSLRRVLDKEYSKFGTLGLLKDSYCRKCRCKTVHLKHQNRWYCTSDACESLIPLTDEQRKTLSFWYAEYGVRLAGWVSDLLL